MTLQIRNMVCRHCMEAVRRIFDRLQLPATEISLGRAETVRELTPDELATLAAELRADGFELLSDPEEMMVERVRHAVMHHVRDEDECRLNLSACIERQIGEPYDTVSRIFSRREGRTIEAYTAAQRIERVKELLEYGELTLSEIAFRTGFSSTAHLSRRFKELTGMTPTAYRNARTPLRRPLPEA